MQGLRERLARFSFNQRGQLRVEATINATNPTIPVSVSTISTVTTVTTVASVTRVVAIGGLSGVGHNVVLTRPAIHRRNLT